MQKMMLYKTRKQVMKMVRMKVMVLMMTVILIMSTLVGCGNTSTKSESSSQLDSSSQIDSTHPSGDPYKEENTSSSDVTPKSEISQAGNQGTIFLVGEMHGKKPILDKELELWGEFYQQDGMRHLFVELGYYSAEFLNVWMQEPDDTQLELLYSEWQGTACYSEDVKAFYKQIKKLYPETIFHGTDVGHQYDTTGKRYLSYLEDHQLKDSDAYIRTKEVIKQGKRYYGHDDGAYREKMMIENFKWAFDQLDNTSIMGIYGAYHIGIDIPKNEKVMVMDLKDTYGDRLTTKDLTSFVYLTDPLSVETVEINGTQYEASYFGKEDLNGFKGFAYREFWRIENAYETLSTYHESGDYLPHDNYPMVLHANEAYMIRYTKQDGSTMTWYYVTKGKMKDGEGKTYQVKLP